MDIFANILEQALLLLPLVLGMYISYCILNITDLTVDGTFVLGAVIFAKTIQFGVLFALTFSMFAGIIAGVIVSLMQKNDQVNPLVVGILATFMLYSVNLQILGRPNISLLNEPSLITIMNIDTWIIPLIIIGILLIISLIILLKSSFGLSLRAFGLNQKLLKVLGKPVEYYRIFGLSLSNMLAALSGALTAQANGFTDINMGFGVALISIGAIVIGRHILTNQQCNFQISKEILSCLIGMILYFFCLNILLIMGINPINLKLILGLLLFISLRKIKSSRA
jgi:putative ABC transport system permease protein